MNVGVTPIPSAIIEVIIPQLFWIIWISSGFTNEFVIWEVVLTFNGVDTPQFKSVFCAINDGIADEPLFIIPSIIANDELIFADSTSVPLTDEVIFVWEVTLINLSSLVIIRGVSKIIFLTINSEIILAYWIPPAVSLFWVVVAMDG